MILGGWVGMECMGGSQLKENMKKDLSLCSLETLPGMGRPCAYIGKLCLYNSPMQDASEERSH